MAKSGVSRAGRLSAGPRLVPLLLGVVLIVAIAAVFWRPRSGGNDLLAERPQQGAASSQGAEDDVNGDGEGQSQGANVTEESGSDFATKLHENRAGGYSFRYPAQWELEKEGSVTRVARPDRHFIVSFGLGPVGGLPLAYDEFVALLDDSYEDVVIDKFDATQVKGRVGVVVRGAATAGTGVRVRIRAAVIGGKDDGRAIGALAATDTNVDKWPRAVLEIIESFRPI